MFLIAIAFLLGHCILHSMPALPDIWPWGATLFASALLLALLRFKWRNQTTGASRQFITASLALCLGIAWAWAHAVWQLADDLPASKVQVDADIVGYIASTLTASESGVRFTFELRDASPELPSRVELTWYDTEQTPAPGELWQLRVRLKPPRGYANPGSADFEAQLFRNGIGATGYVRDSARDAAQNRRIATANWRYPVLRTRAFIANKLDRALAEPSSLRPMLGIVQGLAVGDTSHIDSAQWQVFANTGTTHLIAISGSHIGMVAMLIAWLSGFVARRLPIQSRRIAVVDVQAIFGMSAAIVYSALAGFSVPTQRTLVMLMVYYGTRLLRRQVNFTHGLSVAIIGVLLIDPFAPLSPGFWLSFGAVAAIFLATSGRVSRASWQKEYLHLQLVVSIGLLPFLIGAFGSVSLISPLVNLLAIPWFTFVIVPIVLFGSLLLLCNDWLGTEVVHFAAQLLQWSWPVMKWGSTLPMATWHLPLWPFWIGVSLTLGCFILIAPGMLATRMAGAMLCLPALCWRPAQLPPGSFQLAMLDVGQGLSVVVQTRAHTLVYDAGPSFRSGRDAGQLVVLPYLYSRAVHRIDLLMVSHGDNDHVGGAISVVQGLPTRRILVGPSVTASMIASSTQQIVRAEFCARGESWEWDDVKFEVLHPEKTDIEPEGGKHAARKTNDTSCVLRIAGVNGSAVLTGDIEKQTEAYLVATHAIPVTDIVVVPHHGSRTSSTEDFVAATLPHYALISAGFGNRWGFPKPEVIAHWRAANAKILTTAESGAIEITVEPQGVGLPHAYRVEHRAYWRE